MKIDQGYRTYQFEHLLAISDSCYDGDERPTREEFRQMLSISETWVAWEPVAYNGIVKPIGFVIVKEVGETIPYLWSLAVHSNWQKCGRGSQLLAHVCTKYKTLELHCRADSSVQKLYFDHGFRVIEVAKNYYKMGDKFVDGLKMMREV
jgi:ribosomal protein S18 acetylase RimI-like enzyme